MKHSSGNAFIPLFISSNLLFAISAPYLIILLRNIGYTPFRVGVLLSIFEVAGIAGPIVLGYLSDKRGNYRFSLLLSCLLPGLVIFPLIIWVNPVLSAVFLLIFAFGLRSILPLIDAITTIQIGASGNYGRLRVWGSLAFISMTMFLQWTPFLKPDNAFNISIWIFVSSIICLIPTLILRKTLFKTIETPSDQYNQFDSASVSKKYIFCGFSIIFLSRFGLTAIFSYLTIYVIEVLEWDAVGLLWGLGAVSEVPFIFLSKKIIKRFGAMTLLAVSAFGVCLRLLVVALLPFKPWLIFSAFLHSICFGIYHPAAIQFISSIFPPEKRGRGMSLFMIMGTGLPAIAGVLAGGAIVQSLGFKPLFLIYAGISGLSIIIYFLTKFKNNHKIK